MRLSCKRSASAPEERYTAVHALAADIRHRGQEPVLADEDSLRHARRRVKIAAAAAVSLSLVAGTAIADREAQASQAERGLAVASLRRSDRCDRFQRLPADRSPSRREADLERRPACPRRTVGEHRYAQEPELKVHLLVTLADRYQEKHQFTDVRRVAAGLRPVAAASGVTRW